MRKKADQSTLQEILRARGAGQSGLARPNVTEIRSCGVMGHHGDDDDDEQGHGDGKDRDDKERGDKDDKKGSKKEPARRRCRWGLMIMWEFTVEYHKLDEFHAMLAAAEPKLAARIDAHDATAAYLGTFILHAGGTPRYRTVWGYRSQKAMVKLWAKALKSDKQLAGAAADLRRFWLADPQRSEARWILAEEASFSAEDAPFARLTINAAKGKSS